MEAGTEISSAGSSQGAGPLLSLFWCRVFIHGSSFLSSLASWAGRSSRSPVMTRTNVELGGLTRTKGSSWFVGRTNVGGWAKLDRLVMPEPGKGSRASGPCRGERKEGRRWGQNGRRLGRERDGGDGGGMGEGHGRCRWRRRTMATDGGEDGEDGDNAGKQWRRLAANGGGWRG